MGLHCLPRTSCPKTRISMVLEVVLRSFIFKEYSSQHELVIRCIRSLLPQDFDLCYCDMRLVSFERQTLSSGHLNFSRCPGLSILPVWLCTIRAATLHQTPEPAYHIPSHIFARFTNFLEPVIVLKIGKFPDKIYLWFKQSLTAIHFR